MSSLQIEQILHSLKLPVGVLEAEESRAITIYPVRLGSIRAQAIEERIKDIEGRLGLTGLRGAFISGSSLYGLELPNKSVKTLQFNECKVPPDYQLPLLLGEDARGITHIIDLAKAPHVLSGGASGKGKSNLLNVWVSGLLQHYSPIELKLLLIDVKQIELTRYDGLPQLIAPVITEPREAEAALAALVVHMDERYTLMRQQGAVGLQDFNNKVSLDQQLPQIVVAIDELADLMLSSKGAVEEPLARLAAKGRASGIHLIICTQRPQTDVLTGLIKVNIPHRVAFAVNNYHDSRTILDESGAESLFNAGELLHTGRTGEAVRILAPLITEEDISAAYDRARAQNVPPFSLDLTTAPTKEKTSAPDEAYIAAKELAQDRGGLTVAMLLESGICGKNKAPRIMKQLRAEGVLGEHNPQINLSPLLESEVSNEA